MGIASHGCDLQVDRVAHLVVDGEQLPAIIVNPVDVPPHVYVVQLKSIYSAGDYRQAVELGSKEMTHGTPDYSQSIGSNESNNNCPGQTALTWEVVCRVKLK